MARYKVKETKVSTVVASNGLEVTIDPVARTMSMRRDGELVVEDIGLGNLVQAAKMVQKISPFTKFVCDSHGAFFKAEGYAQTPTCPECMDEIMTGARANMSESRVEEADA